MHYCDSIQEAKDEFDLLLSNARLKHHIELESIKNKAESYIKEEIEKYRRFNNSSYQRLRKIEKVNKELIELFYDALDSIEFMDGDSDYDNHNNIEMKKQRYRNNIHLIECDLNKFEELRLKRTNLFMKSLKNKSPST